MRTKKDAVPKARGHKGNATSAQDGSADVPSHEEIPRARACSMYSMVALNNASFQEAAPDQHSNKVEQPTSTAKRLKTNQATQGEERGLPQDEDIKEVEMLTGCFSSQILESQT